MRVTPGSRYLGCWIRLSVLVLGIPAPGGSCGRDSAAGVDLHCWCGVHPRGLTPWEVPPRLLVLSCFTSYSKRSFD